jgi:hypothetical protein
VSATEVANESPTSFRGPRQIHIAKRQLLVNLQGNSFPLPESVAKFHVDNPDSRCQLRISIMQENESGFWGVGFKLWLAGADYDQGGPSGELIPHTNVEPTITQVSPMDYPLDGGLRGYSREFVTAADAIMGELTVPALADPDTDPVARVFITARIQPTGQRLPWEEWDEIRRSLKIFIDKKVSR